MAQAKPIEAVSGWTKLVRRTQHGDLIFRIATMLFGLIVIGLVFAVGFVVFYGSAEARAQFGLGFLTGSRWQPVDTPTQPATFGAWPAIFGTLSSSLIALLLGGPIGVGIGIYLAELCPLRLRQPLSMMVELLAAIPSVIYGLWGVFVFVPFFRDYIAAAINATLGQVIPALALPDGSIGRGIMATGFVLAIMILPTVAAITRDVLAVVPNNQRELLLSLGATRWQTIRQAVIPYAGAGIIGAVMLGLGRALGETMAATMIIGNQPQVPSSLFDPGVTAASQVANELTNANSDLHQSALIGIALALFGITLLMNLFARGLIWYVGRSTSGR